MITTEHKKKQLIQASRHLTEWNHNISLEGEARLFLGEKHRYEHQCWGLGSLDMKERVIMIARHVREISQLKQFNHEVRIAIEARHLQERVCLDGGGQSQEA